MKKDEFFLLETYGKKVDFVDLKEWHIPRLGRKLGLGNNFVLLRQAKAFNIVKRYE